MTLRRTRSNIPTFEEVAKLTGDKFTYVHVDVRSMDGKRDMEMLDFTIEGGEEDETRFWHAFSCYGLVASFYDENDVYSLKRVYTDEEITKIFGKGEAVLE